MSLSERVKRRMTDGTDDTATDNNVGRKAKDKKRPRDVERSIAHKMEAFGSDDDIENPSAVVYANETQQHGPREEVMLVMLGQLNRAFRERLDEVTRSVFNTKLQAELAKQSLRTAKDIELTTINGFSKHMKEKYGKYLLQAVNQVDNFLEATHNGAGLTLESFALDVDSIFGPAIVTFNDIAKTETPFAGVDWGDDSEDDWVVEPTCEQMY